jgi:hypothetical protein
MSHPRANSDTDLLQLVIFLGKSGDLDAAAAKAEAIGDKTVRSEAWLAVSRANANLQRWDAAGRALENALLHSARSKAIRVEQALLE